ncbi:MAG TPA: sigma-70 family RNA polymerase sigma factor [Afifellaceae bacterium]|nr:sigma-70 family RNA polymerase sigma factor [Afifellaceae bacterium]
MNRKQAIAAEVPRLRRYARALVRDGAEADDLVQDCLARALDRIDQWREGDSPRRWLFTILHNLHVDSMRARMRRPVETSIHGVHGARLSAGPEQMERLAFNDMLEALQTIPPERREALILVGVEGMSYRDAAEVLGIPVGTLMSRLGRGREQLRALLSEAPNGRGHLRSVT